MSKEIQKILLLFLIIFSIYCAITIGETWDENFHINQGKVIIDYLFSLGAIDKDILYRENYSSIYWSLSYLIIKQFPSLYHIEISHLINSLVSISTIIGVGKLSQELFNKKVGKIVFLILFFYPVFFGHMAINSKDTILAFSHVWITYLLLRYLKNQYSLVKSKKYIIFLSILAAMATGIQLVFVGSLIPIIIFFIIDIFFTKKIVNKNFNIKKLIYDFIKFCIIFYALLVFFWIDIHTNIFTSPFRILIATLSESYWTGWPFNLSNGNFYMAENVPNYYLLINYIFKSPEYVLTSYIVFIILVISSRKFFETKFSYFNYKLSLILFILIFPNLIFFLIPYPIYDGMRLFLWTLPYLCIIPGITIYYLLKNIYKISSKIYLLFISIFFIYFLFNFFIITPYQYTYLNVLNGDNKNRYKKFENDYWGASIKELINKSNINESKRILIGHCGVNSEILDNYLKRKGYKDYKIVPTNEAEYIIMTNRIVVLNEDETENEKVKLFTCFDKFIGIDLFKVERNGLLLSVIRKI